MSTRQLSLRRPIAFVAILTGLGGALAAAGSAQGATSAVALRDPKRQPFRTDSIWNMPRGKTGRLVAASLKLPVQNRLFGEENILIMTPDAPLVDVVENNAGWDPALTRCGSIVQPLKVLLSVPIPPAFVTDPGYTGLTPNASAAILMSNGRTVVQTQPFHRCADGSATSQYVFADNDIVDGDGAKGAHGGSQLSAIGGTIRVGELVRSGRIPHALKILLDARTNLTYRSDSTPGFRWPAFSADGYASSEYKGTNPALEMGALLTLRPDFQLAQLKTEPARIIATALRDYGAYVVDDSGWEPVYFAMEWGPSGRVSEEFSRVWGFPFAIDDATCVAASDASSSCDWKADLNLLLASLFIVDDNSPATPGGAGAKMTKCAAPTTAGVVVSPTSCRVTTTRRP